MVMSPELERAINQTKKLFQARDRSEDWGRNIIEGSRGITSEKDWTLYYSYLTNPTRFDPTATLETLDLNEKIAPPLRPNLTSSRTGTEPISIFITDARRRKRKRKNDLLSI